MDKMFASKSRRRHDGYVWRHGPQPQRKPRSKKPRQRDCREGSSPATGGNRGDCQRCGHQTNSTLAGRTIRGTTRLGSGASQGVLTRGGLGGVPGIDDADFRDGAWSRLRPRSHLRTSKSSLRSGLIMQAASQAKPRRSGRGCVAERLGGKDSLSGPGRSIDAGSGRNR